MTSTSQRAFQKAGVPGVRWQNWARTQECRPERVFYPRTVGDLQAIVRAAADQGRKVSVAGRGHTMGPLSLTDDYLIDTRHLTRIGPVDTKNALVTVESGVSVAALDRVLRRHGLAMPTNVVLTSVRYGGIVATGCHGAGWQSRTIIATLAPGPSPRRGLPPALRLRDGHLPGRPDHEPPGPVSTDQQR